MPLRGRPGTVVGVSVVSVAVNTKRLLCAMVWAGSLVSGSIGKPGWESNSSDLRSHHRKRYAFFFLKKKIKNRHHWNGYKG